MLSPIESSNEVRYVRREEVKVKPDQIEHFRSKMHNDVFPSLREQEGIRRLYLLRSAGDSNEFASVTFWNTDWDVGRYTASVAFERNIESVKDLLESEPRITEFAVESHDVNSNDLPAPKSAKVAASNEIRNRSRVSSKRKK